MITEISGGTDATVLPGPMTLLLTGGCGFIGSAVIRYLIRNTDHTIINLDRMTYAASEDALEEARTHRRHLLIKADIADGHAVHQILATHQPDAIMHLAAESHVDRSIGGPAEFIRTNLVGTFTLLEVVRNYYVGLTGAKRERFRFHHISTDEVFGTLQSNDPPFTEATRYDPRSPYSASKAGSDHLVRAWHHTYGLPTIITNTTNNYGPWQYPEKLVPLTIAKALRHEAIPVYGAGSNIRDWLFVEDHAEALVRVLEHGITGETYLIGGRQPRTNLEVVRTICHLLGAPESLIQFVVDRPGHDFRYEIDPTYIEHVLGWRAKHDFESGLEKTVNWYCANRAWLYRKSHSQAA